METVATARLETFCTSGPSPTTSPRVHLLGVGSVGRALLERLAGRAIRVVGATDSTGTIVAPAGLKAADLATHKASGRPLLAWPHHAVLPSWRAPVACDVVVDLSPTDPARGVADAKATREWLAAGARVVLASKHALCADPSLIDHPSLGANAVLGGTGSRLQAERAEIRDRWFQVALAGNASTTTVIGALERGASFEEGLDRARQAGVLEPDPELDLRGVDAALKLALVVGVLRGEAVDPDEVAVQDLRDVDPAEIRARAALGLTTRLVGRASRKGALTLRYEPLALTSPLAVPPTRVAYLYDLGSERRLHVGAGLGAAGTADAVLVDLVRLGGAL